MHGARQPMLHVFITSPTIRSRILAAATIHRAARVLLFAAASRTSGCRHGASLSPGPRSNRGRAGAGRGGGGVAAHMSDGDFPLLAVPAGEQTVMESGHRERNH